MIITEEIQKERYEALLDAEKKKHKVFHKLCDFALDITGKKDATPSELNALAGVANAIMNTNTASLSFTIY